MLEAIAILAGVTLFLILTGLCGAESRPDFVDPRRKHGPFVTAFRLRPQR